MTGLASLSIEHVPAGRAPRQPPDNDERVRAFRAFAPVVHANTTFRFPRSQHERYAAEACADAERSTDDWSAR
jgi:hypothetical protein